MQDQPMTTPTPKPKLRWFQFSLRTLLVFVTLCAFACSWLAVKMKQAERQRKAVEAIRKLGGTVLYDGQLDAKGDFVPNAAPTGSPWLRSVLGDDFFWKVKGVFLNNPQVTDDGLEHLKRFSQLQALGLSDTKVTDAGLEHLKGLSQLQQLWLGGTRVTSSGLEHLKGLNQLKGLYLDGTKVTDEGVKKLQQALPKCKVTR